MPDAASLARVLPVGVCLVGADGRVRYANPAFHEVLDLPPILPGSRVSGALQPAIARGWALEPRRRHRTTLADGRVVEGAWNPLPGGEWSLTVADASGEAQSRRRLRRHNRALAELAATKTELVSALLHEVRTPLTAATMMAGMLPDSPDTLAGEAVRVVGRNLRRLEQVTAEIATISAIENGTLTLVETPVRLDELLAEVVAELEYPVEVAVAEPGVALGDPERLAEAFHRVIVAVGGGPLTGRVSDGRWWLSIPLPPDASADRLFTSGGEHGNATALMFARAVLSRLGGGVTIESPHGIPALTLHLPLEES